MLGKRPTSKNNVVDCVRSILNNPEKYGKIRDIAKKYYPWSQICKRLSIRCEYLINKYY